MAWATIALMRLLSGLSTTDISDADATTLITYADLKTRQNVFAPLISQSCDGTIDGSNKVFQVTIYPIADADASGTVDGSDITAYLIKNNSTTGFDESAATTVSTVNARDGIITLATAPTSTTADSVVADYYLTKNGVPTSKLAYTSSLALSWLAFCKILGTKGVTPQDYSWDGFRVSRGAQDSNLLNTANKLLTEFNNECNAIKPGRAMLRNDDTTVSMNSWITDRETG